jgi:hypothetical protein
MFTVTLDPVDWALVAYYAKKRSRRPEETVQWMVNLYTNADRRFDPEDFLAFVRAELLPMVESRPVRDRLLRQAVRYAKGRHQADETTASSVQPLARRRRS